MPKKKEIKRFFGEDNRAPTFFEPRLFNAFFVQITQFNRKKLIN